MVVLDNAAFYYRLTMGHGVSIGQFIGRVRHCVADSTYPPSDPKLRQALQD
jgi:hypothetical protein